MKLVLLITLFFALPVFSYENINGNWKLTDSGRACLNKNEINDPLFNGENKKITNYQYEINADSLNLTMTFDGNLLSMNYSLKLFDEISLNMTELFDGTSLSLDYILELFNVEADSVFITHPSSYAVKIYGANNFLIVQTNSNTLLALFKDTKDQFCGGGLIVTPMNRLENNL